MNIQSLSTLSGGIVLPLPDARDAEPGLGPDGGRDSLSQRAYAQIRRSLISSKLRPGHRLILRPLAAELNLSPTPVREALLRLVSEQALALDERGSAIVPLMTRADLRELTDMRSDLEARAAERAVEFATDVHIDELERINARFHASYAQNQHLAMLDANASFHRVVCKAGRSEMILRLLEGLWMRIGPFYALTAEQPFPPLPADGHAHDKLIDALRRRNVADARLAAQLDVCDGNRLLEPGLAGS